MKKNSNNLVQILPYNRVSFKKKTSKNFISAPHAYFSDSKSYNIYDTNIPRSYLVRYNGGIQ